MVGRAVGPIMETMTFCEVHDTWESSADTGCGIHGLCVTGLFEGEDFSWMHPVGYSVNANVPSASLYRL